MLQTEVLRHACTNQMYKTVLIFMENYLTLNIDSREYKKSYYSFCHTSNIRFHFDRLALLSFNIFPKFLHYYNFLNDY